MPSLQSSGKRLAVMSAIIEAGLLRMVKDVVFRGMPLKGEGANGGQIAVVPVVAAVSGVPFEEHLVHEVGVVLPILVQACPV